jgi:hypothetical protein
MMANDLTAALRKIAQENWSSSSHPILLASLPKRLEVIIGSDYRSLLADQSLKSFIRATEATGKYRLVQHPTQSAKVGLLPAEAVYEFPGDSGHLVARVDVSPKDVEGFVRVLDSLTTEELRHVTLPATLVVRILSIR